MSLTILALPAFQDNYLWLIHDGVHAAIVDPGDAGPVLAALFAFPFGWGFGHGLSLSDRWAAIGAGFGEDGVVQWR